MSEFAHEYPQCTRAISEFDRPWLLYIAALFHDIAKGRGGDHSELGTSDAQAFCKEHGLDEEDTELVVWLVRQHLFMSQVAQKQDLSDPDTKPRLKKQSNIKRNVIPSFHQSIEYRKTEHMP
jgi:[protein-PII] uridylyltransferase